MSYDLLQLIAAYTSRAGVDRQFRERAGGAGGAVGTDCTGGTTSKSDVLLRMHISCTSHIPVLGESVGLPNPVDSGPEPRGV